MKTFKRIFLYSVLVILMFYVFLVDVSVEGQLAISAFAEERETIFEGFGAQIVSIVDAMTDEKDGVIFVDFNPIYIVIQLHDSGTLFFDIKSYENSGINFASDGEHLIRVGEDEPFSLNYDKKNNCLFPKTFEEGIYVVKSLVKGEEIKLRYYEDKGTRYNQVDRKLQNIFLGFVYCKAAKLFGWQDLEVSPELPPVKLDIYHPTDPDSKVEALIIGGNPDLMLKKQGGGAYASITVGGMEGFSLSSNGEWIHNGNIMGPDLIIRDSNGIIVFKEEIPYGIGLYKENPDAWDMLLFGDGRWPEGEAAAKKAWESAPLGSIEIDDGARVSLYGFRELWKWGVDNLNFPSLGDDIQTGIETTISTDSSTQVSENEVKELLPILTWERTYGGSGWDSASSLIQTTDGGYAVTGDTFSKGAGICDTWVIKLDSQGNQIWERTYGGSGDDRANSLIQTTDGGYAVAGWTESKDAGIYDTWVIKLDSQGNQIWERTYGGSENDYSSSLIQTTDGGYALAGEIAYSDTLTRVTWIIKLDNKGNLLWKKIYGKSGEKWPNSIIQTADGGYVLAGCTSKGYECESDAWIIKLDSEGNKIWEKTYGGNNYDGVNSIIQTTDGSYAAAGYNRSKGAGGMDLWLINLDNQGNFLWDRTYGGSDNDYSSSLIQTNDGGYAVAGSTRSKGAGDSDAWVLKLDEQDTLIPGVNKLDDEAQNGTEATYSLEGSLHCPETGGYPCNGCSSVSGYINHFKGFNVLTTKEDCYVKLTYNQGAYIGNQNNCEVTIKGEKWLGLEDGSETELVEEINSGRFDFQPANKFVERTMSIPGDNYQYEFTKEGKEFRLYLSRDREEAFKAVPWQNMVIEIKNKETNNIFKYEFEKGIFPLAYSWNSGGMANYGQCVWWAAKRWAEEVDPVTLFPFYPPSPSPQAVNVKTIDSNYQPQKYDVLINYNPKITSELGHYAFVEKVEGDQVYITQFNWMKPGEIYNYISRTWKGKATDLYYSNNPNEEYYFKYYYRK